MARLPIERQQRKPSFQPQHPNLTTGQRSAEINTLPKLSWEDQISIGLKLDQFAVGTEIPAIRADEHEL